MILTKRIENLHNQMCADECSLGIDCVNYKIIAAEFRLGINEALDKMAWGILQRDAKAQTYEECAKITDEHDGHGCSFLIRAQAKKLYERTEHGPGSDCNCNACGSWA